MSGRALGTRSLKPRRQAKVVWHRSHGRRLLNLTEIGRYLNVSTERARQVVSDDPTFPAPASDELRPRNRAQVEGWAEQRWWGTRARRKQGD
jgi:hypothetical protein